MKSVVPARSCRQAGDPWAFNRRRPRILLGAIVWKNGRAPIAATIVVDKPAHNVRAYDREGRLLGYYAAEADSGDLKASRSEFALLQWFSFRPERMFDAAFAWRGSQRNPQARG
jgi:hypothetical protein